MLRSMRISASKLAVAAGLAAALLWTLCALFVAAMPDMAMGMFADMVHLKLNGIQWSMTLGGFAIGLVNWVVVAASFAWLTAAAYNWSAPKTGTRTGTDDHTLR